MLDDGPTGAQVKGAIEKFTRNVLDIVLILSREGRCTGFLPSSRLEPIAPDTQLVGRALEDVLGPDIADRARRHIGRALDTGEVQAFDFWLEGSRGMRLLEARLAPTEAGEVVTLVRDLTEEGGGDAQLRFALAACRGALELAAPYLPRDSDADRAAAAALTRSYGLDTGPVE